MCSVAQSRPTLFDPTDCSSLGSSIHRISQARILEWVAISSSRGSSGPKDQTQVSCGSYLGRWVFLFFFCFTTEPPGKAFKRNTCKTHLYLWKDKWIEAKLAFLLIVSVLLSMYYVINTVLVIRDNLRNKNTTNGVHEAYIKAGVPNPWAEGQYWSIAC